MGNINKALANSSFINFSFNVLTMLFGVFAFVCCIYITKGIESRYFPVIEDFHINSMVSLNDTIVIQGTLNKVRDCEFKSLLVYAQLDDDVIPFIADVRFSLNGKGNTGAKIKQAWGPWNVVIPKEYVDATLTFYSTHSCITLYDTSNQLYEITFNKETLQLM